MSRYTILFLSLCGFALSCFANNTDSTFHQVTKLPDQYLSQVKYKSQHVQQQVDKRTEKALARLSKQERKMQAKLWKIDSLAAKNIFGHSLQKLNTLQAGLKQKVAASSPLGSNPYLDSLQASLKFLDGSKELLGSSKDKLTNASQSVQDLQGSLQQAEAIKTYIREQKKLFKEQLAPYTSLTKGLQKFNKEAYYCGAQIKEYKEVLKEKKKAEAKAMELLKQLPAYNNFLQKHTQLASLFTLSSSAAGTTQSLEGLQTRTQVEQLIEQRSGGNPETLQAFNQQSNPATSALHELKNKNLDVDNAGDMPDFKPNPMKTKSLKQRLEFGANIQFQKSSRYFPTTSDIAAQVAYKFHKNGSLGLGISYKLGMGTGWNSITFSHQGLGLRGFADWKLKGTFFLNGGFEENYLSTFSHLQQLQNWHGWQGSALLGISKKYKISAKLKGNLMLLYDFLAKHNTPQTNPVKLRMGYNF